MAVGRVATVRLPAPGPFCVAWKFCEVLEPDGLLPLANTEPSGKIMPPDVDWIGPATDRVEVGAFVPIPTRKLSDRKVTRSDQVPEFERYLNTSGVFPLNRSGALMSHP